MRSVAMAVLFSVYQWRTLPSSWRSAGRRSRAWTWWRARGRGNEPCLDGSTPCPPCWSCRKGRHMRYLALVLAAALAVSTTFAVWPAVADAPWESQEASAPAAQPTERPSVSPRLTATPRPQRAQPANGDRRNCVQMRGTAYRSPSERSWFLANCVTPEPLRLQPLAPLDGGGFSTDDENRVAPVIPGGSCYTTSSGRFTNCYTNDGGYMNCHTTSSGRFTNCYGSDGSLNCYTSSSGRFTNCY